VNRHRAVTYHRFLPKRDLSRTASEKAPLGARVSILAQRIFASLSGGHTHGAPHMERRLSSRLGGDAA
jgi:hypothetical protein